MNTFIKVVTVSLLLVLTSCSDYKAIRDEVISNNKRVESSLSSYEKSKEVGQPLEELIRSALEEGNGLSQKQVQTIIKDAKSANWVVEKVEESNKILDTYLDYYNSMKEVSEELETLQSILNSSLTIHYFLDDITGIVEQQFLLEFSDGTNKWFSLLWLGGNLVDVKESVSYR